MYPLFMMQIIQMMGLIGISVITFATTKAYGSYVMLHYHVKGIKGGDLFISYAIITEDQLDGIQSYEIDVS